MKKKVINQNLILGEIQFNSKIYPLLKPIEFKISKDEDFYYIENDNLSIIAYGDTKEKALEEFSTHIMYFYNYYKNISNEKLTNNAQKIKKIYEKLFLK